MSNRRTMLIAIWCAWCVIGAGCATVPLPAIDPTGERVFLPTPSYTTLVSPCESLASWSCFPRPAFTEPPPIPPCEGVPPPRPAATIGTGVAAPEPVDRLLLTPAKVVAPINSEVVLLAGLCGREGYLLTKQPIEWMLSPDSVGNIIALPDSDHPHLARLVHHAARRDGNGLAMTRTSTAAHVVTRGNSLPHDDVRVAKGQTWISVSSPTEGVSYVTALARKAENWDTRRQTAVIYWVDMQWAFPSPQIVRAGQPGVLVTTVTKTSTGNPAANAIVNYEIVGGAPALFESGRTTVQVPVDEYGRAAVRLMQNPPGPGTTQVRIQILSASSRGDAGAQAVVGQGFTNVTWSAPGLAVRMTGPPLVSRGGIASYRIEVSNPGDIATRSVGLRLDLPGPFRFLNSQPIATVLGNRLEWSLGNLEPRATLTVQVNCQAASSGEFQLTARAVSPDVAGESAATAAARVVESGVSVRFVDPPTAAVVGSRVEFNFEVTNIGGIPLTNVLARDTFDAGLQPDYNVDPNRPLEQPLGNLAPGQTIRRGVAFIARSPGRLCQTLVVTADGGHSASTQTCVNIAQPVLSVDIRKTGPEQATVGESVRFVIGITNDGQGVLTNLRIVDFPDQSLQASRGTEGIERIDGGVAWTVGTLGPGQSVTREVECTCVAESTAAQNRVEVTADGGIREAAATRVTIRPRSEPRPTPPTAPAPTAPAPQTPGQLDLSVASLGDRAVGDTATFVIFLSNVNDQPDQDVQLTVVLPPDLSFRRVTQDMQLAVTPIAGGIGIGPIRELRARDKVPPIHVETTATRAGKYRVRVRVESRRSPPMEREVEITVNPR